MSILRYANDLEITDLARKIRKEEKSMQIYLTNGQLDGAFLRALTMQTQLEKLMWRLNDLKYRDSTLPG